MTIVAGGVVIGEAIEKKITATNSNSEKKNTSNDANKPGTAGGESSKGSNAN